MSRQRKGKENEAVHGVGTFGKIVSYVVMILVCFISLFPVIWVAISSLKADPLAEPGFTLPSALCFDGYIGVFRDMHIMRYFFNSFKVAGISVVLSIIMISMSAYVVARMNFKFKSVVSVMLMSTLFIPPTAMTFPVYNLINSMGINDTHAGLILIYTCSGIAVSFMVIKNYFLTIPVELEEAARIDGCGYTQTFFKIMLPIARPGILTAAMLAFMNYWNEYYWASMVLTTKELKTVPAILAQFQNAFSTNYNGMFSAIVVILLPPVILFCCFSKYFRFFLSRCPTGNDRTTLITRNYMYMEMKYRLAGCLTVILNQVKTCTA